MQTTSTYEPKPTPAWKSPWVIAWVSLVIIVLGVNALMIFLAATTNPGLVAADYYERGQDYERTLVSRSARDPGWTLSMDIPVDIRAGIMTPIRFFVVDKVGQPVTPGDVDLFVYRPSDAERDFSTAMTREGPGRYIADISLPLIGVWDTLVAVRNGEDEYHVGRRIEVQSP